LLRPIANFRIARSVNPLSMFRDCKEISARSLTAISVRFNRIIPFTVKRMFSQIDIRHLIV
jgi:hypothetical protein